MNYGDGYDYFGSHGYPTDGTGEEYADSYSDETGETYEGGETYEEYADTYQTDSDTYENYEEAEDAGYAQQEYTAESEEDYGPLTVKTHGQANIVVAGVGGAGCNAVNNMIRAGITSAQFIVMNTDLQALNVSYVEPRCRIQLGDKTTEGLGAGSDPEIGRRAAEESRAKIKASLQGIDLLFITAGMGGGTGTGAAPVVAEVAKELGILTVGVVTKPFTFEGTHRMRNAEEGIKNLKNFVDTLLVIPNQQLIEVLQKNVSFKQAFEIADDVLRQGIQSVSDVIAASATINLDFADVRTVLSQKGLAHMGIGKAKGEKRVLDAVRNAVYCPLIENNIEGATAIIISIIGGEDMKLCEVEEACSIIHQVVDPNANIIFGMATKPDKTDQEIQITVIATGFDRNQQVVPGRRQPSIATVLNERAAADELKPEVNEPRRQEFFTPAQRPSFNGGYNAQVNARQQVNAVQNNEHDSEARSSRVETPQRQVPPFLRKLRGDN